LNFCKAKLLAGYLVISGCNYIPDQPFRLA
jgi:hypothetical protein